VRTVEAQARRQSLLHALHLGRHARRRGVCGAEQRLRLLLHGRKQLLHRRLHKQNEQVSSMEREELINMCNVHKAKNKRVEEKQHR
jgi:hypothetical protein